MKRPSSPSHSPSPAGPLRPLRLEIDRLVLRGVSPAHRERILPALEAELTRLMAESGSPRALSEAGRVLELPGGAFRMPKGAKAEEVGTRLARALHGGWNDAGSGRAADRAVGVPGGGAKGETPGGSER